MVDRKLFEVIFNERIKLANIIRDANREYDAMSWIGDGPTLSREYFIADKIIDILNQKDG